MKLVERTTALFLFILVMAAFLVTGCFGGNVEGVRVADATRGEVRKVVSAIGTLEAAQPVDVTPLVDGVIATLNVKEGDYVNAGDVLAILDEQELAAQQAQAEADYLTSASVGDILQGQWQNSTALYEGMEYSSQLFLDMQNQLDVLVLDFYDMVPALMPFLPPEQQEYLKSLLAEERANYVAAIASRQGIPSMNVAGYPASAAAADAARVEAAGYDYRRVMEGTKSPNIIAPIAGYVIFSAPSGTMSSDILNQLLGGLGSLTSSMGSLSGLLGADVSSLVGGTESGGELAVGSHISAGQPAFQIMDLQDMKVNVQVEETDIPYIQEQQPVEIYLDAYPDLTFSGMVAQVGVKSETGSSGTTIFPVVVEMDRTDIPLRLGFNATVDIKVLDKKDVISVPITALLEEGGADYVYVVEDGKAYKREVVTGDRTEEWVEIVSGLDEGERLVVEGVGKVKEGQKVE